MLYEWKQLVNHVLAQSVSDNVAMIVSGIGKIYVGEIVELGECLTYIRSDLS